MTSRLENYELLKPIRYGKICKIMLGKEVGTKNYSAIKIFKMSNDKATNAQIMDKISQEWTSLIELDHPNIIKVINQS